MLITTTSLLSTALVTLSSPMAPLPTKGECARSDGGIATCTSDDGTSSTVPSSRNDGADPVVAKRSKAAPSACSVVPGVPAPPKNDPAWAGNTDGTVVTYVCKLDGLNGTTVVTQRWVPPGAAAVDPGALAQQVLATMGLTAIEIGMVPEEGADRLGVVGMPVWMWVKDPTPSTVGPITASDSAGGITVTLDANVTSIDWDMGDGTVVHCAGEAARGTEYVDSFDLQESPTCGHIYTKPGSPQARSPRHPIGRWPGRVAGKLASFPSTSLPLRHVTSGSYRSSPPSRPSHVPRFRRPPRGRRPWLDSALRGARPAAQDRRLPAEAPRREWLVHRSASSSLRRCSGPPGRCALFPCGRTPASVAPRPPQATARRSLRWGRSWAGARLCWSRSGRRSR